MNSDFLKYPKLAALACSFLLAYVLYHFGYFDLLEHTLNGHGYVSAFIGGLLFSFGFTSPFGVAMLVEIAPNIYPIPAAVIAGFGAFLIDLFIFELLRFSVFHDEIHRLRESRVYLWFHRVIHHESIPERIRLYILWSFAGIIIASPLPDEIGVSIVSGITNIETRTFSVLCFIFNTLGVLFILLLAR
jgi:hypothetical protein